MSATSVTEPVRRDVAGRPHLFEPLPPGVRRAVWWAIGASLVVFLLVATSGRPWTLFDRGPFTSDFFDAQARALLHGRLDVPAATAGIEGFAVRGRTYLYYGVVPALPRLPFVLFTHSLDGRLVVVSRLVALLVALRAVAGIGWQARRLVRPAGPPRVEAGVVAGLVAVVGISSPLLFLAARPVVYHEVELWGTALALVAFDRLLAWWRAPSAAGLAIVGVAATLALNTRGSVGLGPVVALGLVLLDRLLRRRTPATGDRDRRQLEGLALATAVPLAVYALVNLGRFGTVWSIPFRKQVLSSFGTDRQAALDFTHGSLFSLRYLPTAALQYLRPDAVGIQRLFPWFGFGPRAHVIGSVRYDTVDRSSSITAAAPLLCLVALVGLVWLIRHRAGTRPWWFALVGTVAGVLVTWTIGFIADRYLADLVPTLVLAAAPGAWVLAGWLGRRRRSTRRLAVAGLAVLGAWGLVVNTSQAVLTEHLFLVVDPSTRLDFIDLQHRIDGRLFGGSPYRLTLGDEAPRSARTGDLLISGDCDGLYWYDGTSWTALERREGGSRSRHASGPAPGAPATVVSGSGWQIDAETPAPGRLRFVYRSDTTRPVPGPIIAVTPGQELHLSLVADPVTTEVRLTATGFASPLVNAFLVPAAGPVTFLPPFVAEGSPSGPLPAVCGRLLDRAGGTAGPWQRPNGNLLAHMARISDLLRQGRTFSFEFFPPKTDAAQLTLGRTIAELERLSPSFVSVTYGAGGSTRQRTHEVVAWVRRETTITPMAHLTCSGHVRAEIATILEGYRAEGIENILALGGDPPLDGTEPIAPSDYRYAVELVEDVRSAGAFSVGVAAHPELHPRSRSRDEDRRHLAAKLERADFAITQFFFEAEHYVRLVNELADLGLTKPVVPGIMPVTNKASVQRMAELSGAAFPAALSDQLDRVDDPEEVRRIGVVHATELCARLLDAGAPGLHFYTLNRSTATRDIYANLGLPVGSR